MWEKLRVIFTIPELRMKIFLTLLMLAVFRMGYHIPLPMMSQAAVLEKKNQEQSPGSRSPFDRLMETASTLSASDLRTATIFGLGIMPYISASIMLQLLSTVWKPLEDLRKEGETGRKKINEYTRYLTVLLCVIQAYMYTHSFFGASSDPHHINMVDEAFQTQPSKALGLGWQFVSITMLTAGTIFLMWLGEQIDEYGIGNGISLLIMANILARMPEAVRELIGQSSLTLGGSGGEKGPETLLMLALLFVGVVAGVVFITLGQRRIPTQSAKHVRGRRVYGGNRNWLPLKLNAAGVMPIIFASSLLLLPALLLGWLQTLFASVAHSKRAEDAAAYSAWGAWFSQLSHMFSSGTSFVHNALYVVLIYFFCYFWTAIIFNPKEMAENLKDLGTFIPGYRPGKRTADYLEKVMVRITYVGAGFLALVAVIPTLVSTSLGVSYAVASFYGGTGLLIAVSVAFDLVQKIDSHLVMRDYRGLLDD